MADPIHPEVLDRLQRRADNARSSGRRMDLHPDVVDDLVAEVRQARRLLTRALPHIDPNDSDDALELAHAIKEATR